MKKLTGNSLNDLAIKAAKPKVQPYTLRDGDGLFLLVHPNGSKYFQLRTTLHNKRKLIQLPYCLFRLYYKNLDLGRQIDDLICLFWSRQPWKEKQSMILLGN